MKDNSEYDVRQLKLMLDSINSFEKKIIGLDSLIGTLEFLMSVLEVVEEDWEDNFLDEITALERINSINIINERGEAEYEIDPTKDKKSILTANSNLKELITMRLNDLD